MTRARAAVAGIVVLAVVSGACAADAPTAPTAAKPGGSARPGPTAPATDAFTRPLAPGVTLPLSHNVAVVATGDDPRTAEADLAILRRVSAVAVEPDGSVLVADDERGRIVRFRPDGSAELVAGTDRLASTGDGGPATDAGVQPRALAVGPDGTIWISDAAGLRHIDEAGVIATVVPYASGGQAIGPDVLAGASATQSPLVDVRALAIGPDGRPLLGIWTAVYRLEADLTLTHLAGTSSGVVGDGGPATAAGFEEVAGIVSRPDGSLLVLDGNARLVREVSPAGTITTWGGVVPSAIDREVGPLGELPSGIAAGPDGSAIVTISNEGQLVRVTRDAVETILPEVFAPGAIATMDDGSVVYGSATGVVTRAGV